MPLGTAFLVALSESAGYSLSAIKQRQIPDQRFVPEGLRILGIL